jgi:hypothetical protein
VSSCFAVLSQFFSASQGEGKSAIIPIKLLGVRTTRNDDGNWYVTLGASKLALRMDRDGSISDRLLLEDVIRGKIPALAGPNVRVLFCQRLPVDWLGSVTVFAWQPELAYWKPAQSKEGFKYWWNEVTRESRWDKPVR